MTAPSPLVDLAYRIRTNQDLADWAAERARILTADQERTHKTATDPNTRKAVT